MADVSFDFLQVRGKGVKVLALSFAPNGSGAVDATSVKGRGASVTRLSAGLFRLQLRHKYVALLSADVTVQLGSAAARSAQLGAVDVVNAGTIDVRVVDGAGLVADIAADPSNRINVVLYLSNSTLNK